MGSNSLIYKWGPAVLILLFFFSSSFLALNNNSKFNSPDETANAFFAKIFAHTGRLRVTEKLNLEAPIVHPRSINVRGDQLVPGSFIGLILLYGGLIKILGSGLLQFFTPVFAALALAAFYFLVKRVWGPKIALLSALIWTFHPAVLYYTNRGLLPNMPFVSFLIFSAFFAFTAPQKRSAKILSSALSGFCLAISLAIRPNEIIWLLPLIIWLALAAPTWPKNFKKISIPAALSFLLAVFLVLAIIGYYQNQTFGSPWRVGYQQLNGVQEQIQTIETLPAAQAAPQIDSIKSFAKKYVLPFGLHLKLVKMNSLDYLINFFWWLAVPLIWILVWSLKNFNRVSRPEKMYLITGLLMTIWLMIYYGSGRFVDSTLKTATIGTSYVRYWLPIYVWSIPLIAKALTIWPRPFSLVNILAIIILGAGITFSLTKESLMAVNKNLTKYEALASQVMSLTEPESVIITSRTDKFFFPDRKVIHYLAPDYSYKEGVNKLKPLAPVYFFTLLPQKDIEYLNLNEFGPAGWHLEPYKIIGDFTLQRVVPAIAQKND